MTDHSIENRIGHLLVIYWSFYGPEMISLNVSARNRKIYIQVENNKNDPTQMRSPFIVRNIYLAHRQRI